MSRLRITYYAEGHRNGCKVTLHDVCGLVYDDFIIDANRWNLCGGASGQEAIILATARIRYPEVNWESAHYTEIHNA